MSPEDRALLTAFINKRSTKTRIPFSEGAAVVDILVKIALRSDPTNFEIGQTYIMEVNQETKTVQVGIKK